MLIPSVVAEVFIYNVGGYETDERGEYTLVYVDNGELIDNEAKLKEAADCLKAESLEGCQRPPIGDINGLEN